MSHFVDTGPTAGQEIRGLNNETPITVIDGAGVSALAVFVVALLSSGPTRLDARQELEESMPRNSLIRATKIFCITAACAAALAGCNNEEQSGNLVINYDFVVDSGTCADSAVTNIRVTLNDITENEPCGEDGEFTLNSVPAGNYKDVIIEGIDAANITIRDNLDDPEGDTSIEILGGASQTMDAFLTPTPATIELKLLLFDADGAPYLGQSMSPITEFRVTAIESGSGVLGVGDVDVTNLESNTVLVPDEQRNILGDKLNRITVNYTANGGTQEVDSDPATPAVEPFDFAPPGAGRKVTITLTCLADSCSAELASDGEEGTITTGAESATGTGGAADGSTGG